MTGDTTYGTVENIVALEDAGIRAYFPLPDFDHRTPVLRQGAFTYDAERDEYRCPQGQPLPRRKTKYTEEEVRLPGRRRDLQRLPGQGAPAPPATTAASCTAPSTPTTSTGCAATTRPRPTRRRCASGKSGSSRCSPRPRSGTAYAGSGSADSLNVNIQGLLIAAGQNLKRFLAATGWGRRHAPCGSLVALPRSHGGSRRLRVSDRRPETRAPVNWIWSGPCRRSGRPEAFFNGLSRYRPRSTPTS